MRVQSRERRPGWVGFALGRPRWRSRTAACRRLRHGDLETRPSPLPLLFFGRPAGRPTSPPPEENRKLRSFRFERPCARGEGRESRSKSDFTSRVRSPAIIFKCPLSYVRVDLVRNPRARQAIGPSGRPTCGWSWREIIHVGPRPCDLRFIDGLRARRTDREGSVRETKIDGSVGATRLETTRRVGRWRVETYTRTRGCRKRRRR